MLKGLKLLGIVKSDTIGDFPTLGGSRLTGQTSIVYVVMSLRIILRTMALPDKSAATYRPRKSPVGSPSSSRDCFCSSHGSTSTI